MSTQSSQAGMPWKHSIQWKLVLTLLVAAVVPFTVLAALGGPGLLQTTGGLLAVVAQVAGLLFAWTIWSAIARQTVAIGQTLEKISHGDFEARVAVITADELGASAAALNAMCDNTLNLIQSNDEQLQIQASIEGLIAEMEGIAAGDLTISADVHPDITGAIAGSINNMTEQLRAIVQQVQAATEQVTSSASSISRSSTRLSEDSDEQANRISEASGKLLEMTAAFQGVASLTEESAQVAVEARQTASRGLKAVNDTVEGMQRIRSQVQNTSKRIKRLGESSQEIGEIVQLISDIADRTSILALNASIQAAMAGDAGQGFAVVAEEVERLAERSADATKQIAKLIRGIQTETGEAISNMEESTLEVVAGSELASQAGETLFEIDSVSNQLVELIEGVSVSALEQAEEATRIAATMSEISSSTKASAEKSRAATQSVGELALMADVLRDSVSRFKVTPAEQLPAAVAITPRSAAADNPPVAPKNRPAPLPGSRTVNTECQPAGDHPKELTVGMEDQEILRQLTEVADIASDKKAPGSSNTEDVSQTVGQQKASGRTIMSTMRMDDL